VGLAEAFCPFGMIVCPYTTLAVAADARTRVMIDAIVIRWSSIAMSGTFTTQYYAYCHFCMFTMV
jgi:hypothetical protein